MKTLQLKNQRESLLAEMDVLANKADLTADEKTRWSELSNQVKGLDAEIRIEEEKENHARQRASQTGVNVSKDDLKTFERYSFRKAMLAQIGERKLEGVEAEMHQEALREAKQHGFIVRGIGVPIALLNSKKLDRASTGQNVTTVADGGYLVQEEPLLYFEALRNKLLLPGMGAKFLTNLVGDLPLVEGGAFTASWLAEDAVDTATKAAFDELVMKPNRLQCTGALALQLLRQSSIDVERMIENDIVSAHAQGLQDAAINGSGTPPTPRGILNKVGIGSVVGGTNGAVPTWANIVALETEVAIDNAEGPSMAYLTNAAMRGVLKQTEKTSANAQYIWVGNELNGYPAYVTNAVPSNLTKGNQSAVCSAIIFADWSKLYMGQWGGLDIIVDPYTLKKKAEVEVTVISYGDVGVIQPEAFAAMKDAKSA